MDQLIRRDDLVPWQIGLANLVGFGGAGYWWLGQRRKARFAWAAVIIGGPLTCGAASFISFITAYDAYLLAQRLELGEGVGPSQSAVPFFDALFR